MSTEPHPLSFEARQAAKHAQREQIARELREGTETPGQIALVHQPLAALKAEQIRVRYDLAKRLV